jgi:hypothetical protein
MTDIERALQIRPLLAWAARNQQLITYQQVGAAVGHHHHLLGGALGVVARYCSKAKLPPLTAIVVGADGQPGSGYFDFRAGESARAVPSDWPKDIAAVWRTDWLSDTGSTSAKQFNEDALSL